LKDEEIKHIESIAENMKCIEFLAKDFEKIDLPLRESAKYIKPPKDFEKIDLPL